MDSPDAPRRLLDAGHLLRVCSRPCLRHLGVFILLFPILGVFVYLVATTPGRSDGTRDAVSDAVNPVGIRGERCGGGDDATHRARATPTLPPTRTRGRAATAGT